ncbi:MAG TPA: TIGR01212 family radical SAM protein [Lachnospiraceae bacterium]|nr:TIGR01212 family radical SAM protein [Lachnospiraceae bacterium]
MNICGDVYNRYSQYLKNRYGEKVYKLPLNIPVSCPNRVDGKGGCTYCDDKGAGFENLSGTLLIREQLKANMEYIGGRYKANKFIAYFQNFTNTFLPLPEFESYMKQAAEENIVEIAVSTRPDCIRKEYLDVLKAIEEEKGIDITVELGLQSTNCHTLEKINRGHSLAEYIEAMILIRQYGFKTCTHLIVNLPWDDMDDVIEASKVVSVLKTDFIKLHALYIVDGTEMALQYKNNEFTVCTVNEYKKRVITFLRYLSPEVYVQRIIGRAPKENTLFANWNESWWKIRDEIEAEMAENGYVQGDLYNYIGGSAVKRFF